MKQPASITELVYIYIDATPWGVNQKEERYTVKESAKMIHGGGVRIYKEEVGQIKGGYVKDSVFGVVRRAFCLPEDVEEMKSRMLVEIREAMAELQRNLDTMKNELEEAYPEKGAAA